MTERIQILLVDDEAEFRDSTARVLGRRGFDVRQAENGERALEEIARERPDVVLLDLKMEGMDGITALRRIRAGHGELPVIILTGHGDYSTALAGIRLDVVDFLQKPIDVEELADRIRWSLARSLREPLRERAVGELMIPAGSYRVVHADEDVRVAIDALRASLTRRVVGRVTEVGHRSVLVVDRDETFVGIFRRIDLIRMVVPEFLRDTPYGSCFTGMFLAQCKVLGGRPVGDCLSPDALVTVVESAPLMEAAVKLTRHNLPNLPVMRGRTLVGVLRDRDVFQEITRLGLGG